MRTLALLVDDAAAVRQVLQQRLDPHRRWRVVLVACPPRLTHHASRFLTQACRAQFRQRWARALFAQLQPLWAAAPAGTVETLVAQTPVPEVLRRLRETHGAGLQVLDARRQRREVGDLLQPQPLADAESPDGRSDPGTGRPPIPVGLRRQPG